MSELDVKDSGFFPEKAARVLISALEFRGELKEALLKSRKAKWDTTDLGWGLHERSEVEGHLRRARRQIDWALGILEGLEEEANER